MERRPPPRPEEMDREALLAEVERLRWLVDVNPQVPWEADPEGNITNFSQRWLDLTGMTRAQALGEGWTQVQHPDDLPKMVETWTRSLRTGKSYDVRHRIRLADGDYRWMRSWAIPKRDAVGRIVAWYGSTEDVQEVTVESERLAATADALPALVLHIDTTMRYRFCNRQAEVAFGRPRSEVVGRTVREIVGEATFRNVLPYLERAFAGEVAEWAMWVDFPTGRRFTRTTYVPSRGLDGKVVGIDVLAADETEGQLVQDALRESESQYRQIAEGIAPIVWTTRPDGYHDFFNERWYEYTGMAHGGERGWQWKDYLHPDDYERTLAVWTRCLETGEPYEIEYRFKRHDGAYRWFLGQALPIRGEDGAVVRWFGTLTDIHDQKEAEAALRRSGETFESLVRNSPQGVYAVDADFRLALVSQGAQRVFENVRPLIGRDFEEVMRTLWEEPFAGETLALFRRTLETGEPYHAPSMVETRRDVGETEAYDWKIERIAMPDGRLGVVCHFYDLSERQRQEVELQRRVEARTQELSRANRDLDQFAYSVAHDLRAPLRSIVSSSRILLEETEDRLSPEERATLERQAASGLRLARIVDDLLGFARLASAEVRKSDFDLTALARATTDEVGKRWEAGCAIEIQEGMRAQGDPNLVGYALTNLIDNACKFSRGKGVVTVGERDGAFFVRDQGVGFDMAHAHKLFVAFERLVGQDAFEGTGVGLANVRRIIEKHGGRIWAESEPGKGATFWFTLTSV